MTIYNILLKLAWIILHVIFKIKIHGNNKEVYSQSPFIIVSNHLSSMDHFFVLVSIMPKRKVYILAKRELFTNRLISSIYKKLGLVPVTRGAHDNKAIDYLCRMLMSGNSVLIFPEGTRSRNGRIGEVHSGAIRIGLKTGIRILPCVINYNVETSKRIRRVVEIRFSSPISATSLGNTMSEKKDTLRSILIKTQGGVVDGA